MAEKNGKGSTRETEGNVDQIREILFGGQLRDFDRRFSDLEDKLRRDLERARTDLLKRGDNLETLIRDQTEALNQQIKRLEGDFRKHQGTTADQLKRLDDAIRAELDAADAKQEDALKVLRERLLKLSNEAADALQQQSEEFSQSLTTATESLRESKVAREELAGFLTEMALRLNRDFDLPTG